jgi:hypothetical protein
VENGKTIAFREKKKNLKGRKKREAVCVSVRQNERTREERREKRECVMDTAMREQRERREQRSNIAEENLMNVSSKSLIFCKII